MKLDRVDNIFPNNGKRNDMNTIGTPYKKVFLYNNISDYICSREKQTVLNKCTEQLVLHWSWTTVDLVQKELDILSSRRELEKNNSS